jgi:hypothetical protein
MSYLVTRQWMYTNLSILNKLVYIDWLPLEKRHRPLSFRTLITTTYP